MKVSYNWLQIYFKEPLPEVDKLAELFTFHSFEIEGVEKMKDDAVIEGDILPNRSSDCLSHRGIAREISNITGMKMKMDPLYEPIPEMPTSKVFVSKIEEPKLCARYMGAVVTGIKVGPSPEWLQKALKTLGQRSINNIVDATNYVMLNVGQPMHAFDIQKLAAKNGVHEIVVRRGKKDEKITVLTGETYTVDENDLLIADGISGASLAVAGIKGGKQAEIDANTTSIVLESANFDYGSVRKTSKKLKLVTDASLRFQNEPSPEFVGYAMRDVIKLVLEIAGGKLEGVSDSYITPATKREARVTLKEINKLLGTEITEQEVENIFVQLAFTYKKDGEYFVVTSPFERTDIKIKEDLIEEVGRVYGYKNVKAILPPALENKPKVNKTFYYSEEVRRELIDLGFSEVSTYTFCSKGEVELENPLASDKSFMRANLTDGITNALVLNEYYAALLGLDVVKVFEIGTVFKKDGEKTALCVGVRNVRVKKPSADKIVEEVKLFLEDALQMIIGGVVKNGVLEVVFDDVIAPLPEPKEYAKALGDIANKRFEAFSQYPFMLRDVALWVPEKTVLKDVQDLIEKNAGDLLVRADLFDEFHKEERTSLAFHLVFQSKTKTLIDVEINEIMEKVYGEMKKNIDWEVR
jgi:phenylalanyl-tRNA synthetase beta chain